MGGIDVVYRSSDAVAWAGLEKGGEVSTPEVVEAGGRAIEELKPGLYAVIDRRFEIGRAEVARVDLQAPLAGVPFLLKELASSWAGVQANKAPQFLDGQVAQGDSDQMGRIKVSGLCLLGKMTALENRWSITTEPALSGPGVNLWDAGVTPGGASGGAAVATGKVPIAEASDGPGSRRVPASCRGGGGLKPSRVRVTQALLADYWAGGANFLCNTRTEPDSATYLDAVVAALPGDPHPVAAPVRPSGQAAGARPRGAACRVCRACTGRAAVETVAFCPERMGQHREEMDMGLDTGAMWRGYTDMTCVETAGFHRLMESVGGRQIGPGDVENVTAAIMARGLATSGEARAERVEQVRQTARAIAKNLGPYDIDLTPVLSQRPRPAGYCDMAMADFDAFDALWSDAVTGWPFGISGQPAIALPLGVFADGFPLGVQVAGRQGDEATVLAVAGALEEALPWAGRRPSAGAGHA